MANCIRTARSNYFRVKDEAQFRAWAERCELTVEEGEWSDGSVCFMIMPDDRGGWPLQRLEDPSDPSGEYEYFCIEQELAQHLHEDDVAILMEVGHELSRYVVGVALAVNAKGETRRVCLDDIYDLAAELGKEVTQAEY